MYKLLLADDEVESRSALSRYFPWNEIGFEIIGQVDNGQEVLSFLSRTFVDVILCDIRMPLLDGLAVAKHLYESKSKTKIIFISGFRDFSYVQQALCYGVRNYILKPTKYDEITNVFLTLKRELDRVHEDDMKESLDPITADNSTIKSVMTFINDFLPLVTLENTATQVHMNPTYFSQYFKKHTGMGFFKYLTELRMKKAQEMLDANEKVNDIAREVGYSSTKAFSRAFFKYFKCSPTEYRQKVATKI